MTSRNWNPQKAIFFVAKLRSRNNSRKQQKMLTNSQLSASRILFVDIARIYGVALVFYGHIIESYMKAGSPVAAVHYKFVYSFHMPLFFILSGYIAKELLLRLSVIALLKIIAPSPTEEESTSTNRPYLSPGVHF